MAIAAERWGKNRPLMLRATGLESIMTPGENLRGSSITMVVIVPTMTPINRRVLKEGEKALFLNARPNTTTNASNKAVLEVSWKKYPISTGMQTSLRVHGCHTFQP